MDLSETGIVNDTLIGPFGVPERVKINSKAYIDFPKKIFMPWYEKQLLVFKRKAMFMQDGALAYSANLTKDFLDKMGFNGARLMTWHCNSSDFKTIENLSVTVKRHVFANIRQLQSKDQLWTTIQEVCKQVKPQQILNPILSVNKRVFTVVLKQGNQTGY